MIMALTTGHVALNGEQYSIEVRSYRKSLANQFAAKLGQGAGNYGDLSDWSAWAMADWRAGVGQRSWDAGGTAFSTLDSRFERQLSPGGDITLVGRDKFYDGATPIYLRQSRDITDEVVVSDPVQAGGVTHIASRFTGPTFGAYIDYITVYKYLTPGANDTIRLRADSGGVPGTLLGTFRFGSPPNDNFPQIPFWQRATIDTAVAVSSGVTYWLEIRQEDLPQAGYERRIPYIAGAAGSLWNYGAGYVSGGGPFIFKLNLSGWTPDVLAKHSAGIQFNGAIYMAQNSYLLKYNPSTTDWDLVKDYGSDTIVDLEVFDDHLFIAFGSSKDFEIMDQSGTPVFVTGGKTAHHFLSWGGFLYRATANAIHYTGTSGGPSYTWTADIEVGEKNTDVQIRGLAGMGNVKVYIATDEGLYFLAAGDFVYRITRWPSVDSQNGVGMVHHQGAVYVPMAFGIVRVTVNGQQHQLQNIGLDTLNVPGHNIGLGRAVALASSPMGLFALVTEVHDPDKDVRNRVLSGAIYMWNDLGWHIATLLPPALESIAGHTIFIADAYDKLIVGMSGFIGLYPLPKGTNNPILDREYVHAPYSWMETPWFDADLIEVYKDVESVYINSENVTEERWVRVWWLDDDSTQWEPLGDITSDTQEMRFVTNRPATRRLKLGFTVFNAFQSTFPNSVPTIRAIRLKYMNNVLDKFLWTMAVRFGEELEMIGENEHRTLADQLSDLDIAYRSIPPIPYTDIDGTDYSVKVTDARQSIAKYAIVDGAPIYEGIVQLTMLQVV